MYLPTIFVECISLKEWFVFIHIYIYIYIYIYIHIYIYQCDLKSYRERMCYYFCLIPRRHFGKSQEENMLQFRVSWYHAWWLSVRLCSKRSRMRCCLTSSVSEGIHNSMEAQHVIVKEVIKVSLKGRLNCSLQGRERRNEGSYRGRGILKLFDCLTSSSDDACWRLRFDSVMTYQ